MEILWIACCIAIFMLVWFNTDALIDWAQLFGLGDLFNVTDFYLERMKFGEHGLNYPSYLKFTYYNFLTKLIACPICLSWWMVIAASFFFGFILFDLSLILFIPITYILTLLIYGSMSKLLK